jgi:hypothetical protein
LSYNRETLLVEGEQKANLLRSWGIPATCNPMGAEKWCDEYSAFLRGARVVILPDNDAPGRRHINKVAASLVSFGCLIAPRCIILSLSFPTRPKCDFAVAVKWRTCKTKVTRGFLANSLGAIFQLANAAFTSW